MLTPLRIRFTLLGGALALLLAGACATSTPVEEAPAADPAPEVAPPPAPEPPPAPVAILPAATPDVPCKRAVKGTSPIAKACAEGGISAAKQAMKDLVKRARVSGTRYTCDDCHTDETDYAKLTRDAQDKFAKLVAAAGKK